MANSKEITVNGVLFDLDGTLINSQEGVERFWHDWAEKNGFTGEEVLKISHGTRTIEVFRHFKPEMATEEHVAESEKSIPSTWGKYSKAIPGGKALVESIPKSQWGVVTSGTRMCASAWLQDFLNITPPDVFITAESVTNGKPDPAGYKMAAEKLGLEKFLVFEDAPAGIKAGLAAGAQVIGLATTYDADFVKETGANVVINDLSGVKVKSWDPETNSLTLVFEDCVY